MEPKVRAARIKKKLDFLSNMTINEIEDGGAKQMQSSTTGRIRGKINMAPIRRTVREKQVIASGRKKALERAKRDYFERNPIRTNLDIKSNVSAGLGGSRRNGGHLPIIASSYVGEV